MKQTILIALFMTACNAQCSCGTQQDTGCGAVGSIGGSSMRGGFKMQAPRTQEGGFGKISARSKGQSQNAAKAQNEYEDQEEKLDWSAKQKEVESGQSSDTGYLVSKQFINIAGTYESEEDICDTTAAKVGESGRSASCFRREAGQHLNEIACQNLPEPLEGRELCQCGCDCDCDCLRA